MTYEEVDMVEPDSGLATPEDILAAKRERERIPAPSESEGIQLASRFLLGLMLMGSDQLRARLQTRTRMTEGAVEPLPTDAGRSQSTTRDLLGYMAIGAFAQGQRRLTRRIHRGVRFSLGTADWVLGTVNRLTDNRLAQPLRRSVEPLILGVVERAEQLATEGQSEVEQSRSLARRATREITQDLVEEVAENPELARMVKQIVGRQSATLAGTVVSNARQMSSSADDVVEALVRRLLRLRPRRELPSSPLMGEPQTMYAPGSALEGGADDDH